MGGGGGSEAHNCSPMPSTILPLRSTMTDTGGTMGGRAPARPEVMAILVPLHTSSTFSVLLRTTRGPTGGGGNWERATFGMAKFGAENIWHQFLKCHCDNLVPILRLLPKNKRRPGTVGVLFHGPLVGCSDFPEALGHSGTAHAKRANSNTQKNGFGPSNTAALLLCQILPIHISTVPNPPPLRR